MNLFQSQKVVLNLPQADLVYIPNFYNPDTAQQLFHELQNNIAWQHDTITVFGKTYPQPRLTALYATNNKSYSYSNITMHPKPFTPTLKAIKTAVENEAQTNFTTVLLNLYRSGSDSNGWHADNEKELGINPVIASVSLGAPRVFHFKHKDIKTEKHKLVLESGSLLVMSGEMQHYWLHQIPKTKKNIGARINLTFRHIL
ncbi:alpha-ketoglutarate-dependent dioxygenase AlkB family protein [Bizionia sediminis]|uniref:Alpha-ketoglutarate-dependent dioxygenase AlkB family protein n=1 Tax=Bizionia sediminis TaxID=1737064 RepID=A0ABW5KU44_9FLAO